MKAARKI